ncbi:MAG: TIR domain-containing protein [Promethearchaeota archaeon]
MAQKKKYYKIKYPSNNEEFQFRYKADFYTVNPSFWDSSGMKFDNEQRMFYGPIPDTDIPTVLTGTKFLVQDKYYDHPAVNSFVSKIITKFPIPMKESFDHDLAVSFAGEDRKIVEIIATQLFLNNANVFYDNFFKSDLVGKDLSDYFKEKYGDKSKFVVIFLSKYYLHKDWTNFEYEIARDEARRRKEVFILPVRLDYTIFHGLKRTIGFIDFQKEKTNGTIRLLLEKINLPYNVKLRKIKEIKEIENQYILIDNNDSQIKEIEDKIKAESKNKIEILYEIPQTLSPFDDRVDIIKNIIRNLMIEFFKEGKLNGNFDNNKSERIKNLITVINGFDNTFYTQYLRNGISPNYNKLSRLFFGCSRENFEKRLIENEIQKDKINRDPFILAGDLALEILIQYENDPERSTFLVKDIHWALYYSIERNRFFQEPLRGILEPLKILKNYGLIKLRGEDYKTTDDLTEYQVPNVLRLKDFINWKSINFLLNKVENYRMTDYS